MRIILLSCFTFICLQFFAQDYSRVKIYTTDDRLVELNNLGLALDDVDYKRNTFIVGDFSEAQISAVENAGFTVEVMIADVIDYYVQNSTAPAPKNTSCGNSPLDTITNPTNFHLGTYAGYYTYSEYLTELDEMYAAYPNLITQKMGVPATPVDTTLEGRPLYYVKISDNPTTDEAEPEVLYTSIHHAREPGSLIQNIYFMWYILENYGTDPEITFLVDNTELYFIPMINPDGYVYNETTNPNGGGMHRKNRRNVGFTNKGVDLNRNYSYQWGTTGVDLNNYDSDVYPGTNPFSENETKIVKWFIENHNIEFASNAHTHGDLLLFPVGATVQEMAVDHDYFQNYTSHMAQFNGFQAMKSSGLYPASGDSDDYMYKDHGVFAITPEIGNGFWPPMSAIEGMCKDMLFPNVTMSLLPHKYATIEDLSSTYLTATSGNFDYEILRLGLENGAIGVSINPVQGIQTVGAANSHDIAINTTDAGSFSYQLDANVQLGDLIIFEYVLDFGGYTKSIKVEKIYGFPNYVVNDALDTDVNWVGQWGLTTQEFVSPDQSMAESPFSQYTNSSYLTTQLNDTIDLSSAIDASISFMAKWSIEDNYDYVQFQVSTDYGNTWQAQCGQYTNLGANNGSVQPTSEPLYDGIQSTWVEEVIGLSEYFGQKIVVRFVFQSDNFVTDEGFFFDDFKVSVNNTNSVDEEEGQIFRLYPNPTKGVLNIFMHNASDETTVEIYTMDGKLMQVEELIDNQQNFDLDVSALPQGAYLIKIKGANNVEQQRRFIKM